MNGNMIRILLYSLAIILLVTVLCVGIFSTVGTSDVGTESSSGFAEASIVKEIHIEWASGTIVIQPGDTTEITFSETYSSANAKPMSWKQVGEELTIQFSASTVNFLGFGVNIDSGKDLIITVPRDWNCRELELDVASAMVEIKDMTIAELSFDGASGTCSMENCAVTELDIDTASGDVTFSGTLNTLDFDGASSSFTAVLSNTPDSLDMDAASGDLAITLPEDCGFTAEIDALSGDFVSDFPTITRNGCYIYGDGRCRITVDGMSGDVTVRKGE